MEKHSTACLPYGKKSEKPRPGLWALALALSLSLNCSPIVSSAELQIAEASGSSASASSAEEKDKEKKQEKDSDDSKKSAGADNNGKDSKDIKKDKKEKAKDKSKSKEKLKEKDKDKNKGKDKDKQTSAGDSKTKDQKAEDDTEKKKSGGLFHLGKKKEDKEKSQEEAATEAAKAKDGSEAKKAEKPKEDPNAPKYKIDPALISVLKDISKSLKDSDAVKQLEDPMQKKAAEFASDALSKALSAPELNSNRIVVGSDKDGGSAKGMSAEAWESGTIDVSPDLKASLLALWAKKADGILSLQIVGAYSGKEASDEETCPGEFIVLITGRSAVDKGFDIQTQQEVNYWIGKVADLKIECAAKGSAQKDLKSLLDYLHVPITERKRQFLLSLKDYQDKLAQAEKDKEKQAEISAAQKQVAETLARKVAEALAKSVGGDNGLALAAGSEEQAGGKSEKKSEGVSDLNKAETPVLRPPTASELGAEALAVSEAGKSNAKLEPAADNKSGISSSPTNTAGPSSSQANSAQVQAQSASASSTAQGPAQVQAQSSHQSGGPEPAGNSGQRNSIASIFPDAAQNSRSSWESPGGPSELKSPSSNALLVFPARALAGHYITVAVQNQQNNIGEACVGLSLNGAQLATAENGKLVYQVPEDLSPGYTLNLGLSARPEAGNNAIEILQPLAHPLGAQVPNVEGVSAVCTPDGMLTISGHNFDGIAERNRIIVDGAHDANVVVSSPVQLKARLPQGLPAGPHSICVSTSGLRSNPGNFDLVTVDISAAGPDTPKNDLKKLTVKVSGTQNRVRVKLVNQSRDIIRLVKGDELVVVTSGGSQNQTVVPVQRLRWGNYKIDAEILI